MRNKSLELPLRIIVMSCAYCSIQSTDSRGTRQPHAARMAGRSARNNSLHRFDVADAIRPIRDRGFGVAGTRGNIFDFQPKSFGLTCVQVQSDEIAAEIRHSPYSVKLPIMR
jgi:hypothetical protein